MDATQEALIRFYSARFGIPFELSKAQMMAESSGNANALSSEGARGLFQVMPATATDLLFDEEVNVMVSRFYLKLLYDLLKPIKSASLASADRWLMAIAAYDAGPGALDRIRKETVLPDDYDSIAKLLPEETRKYVDRIWAEFTHAGNSQG